VVALGVVLTSPRAHPDPLIASDVRSTLDEALVAEAVVGHPHGRLFNLVPPPPEGDRRRAMASTAGLSAEL
jgi:hypothetical protein